MKAFFQKVHAVLVSASETVDCLAGVADGDESFLPDDLCQHVMVERRKVLGFVDDGERVLGEFGREAGWHVDLIIEIDVTGVGTFDRLEDTFADDAFFEVKKFFREAGEEFIITHECFLSRAFATVRDVTAAFGESDRFQMLGCVLEQTV